MDCFKVRKWRLRQEPDESRGSRPVLRGPWGAVHRGYSATTTGCNGTGGQDCPTVYRGRLECHLRDRLSRVLLRISQVKRYRRSRAQPASVHRRSMPRNLQEKSGLGARRRHPWFLRCHRPQMDDTVPRAPDWRQARHTFSPKVGAGGLEKGVFQPFRE